MPTLIVIPARMEASRFPGKPLVEIAGRSLILRVCDQAAKVGGAERLLVATDSEAILQHVKDAGYEAALTSSRHSSGSDRVAEAAGDWQGMILNLQGDEPLADPELLDRLIARMEAEPSIDIGTVGVPLVAGELLLQDRVKVCVNKAGRALDFRRLYDSPPEAGRLLRHAGVYLYRAGALAAFSKAQPCEREKAERLEQLRALEMGLIMHVEEGADWAPGVDRPEDLKVIVKRLEES
ncbi:3-deoxy-manno-octulosonate cytidylyltransferase [bacterium]|nr:3-deoxy-manno-octulosonate cytidylyltransferase [bacterium]